MSNTLILLAVASAIALPAIGTATLIYPLGAASFVALAAVANRFFVARAGLRGHVRRVA